MSVSGGDGGSSGTGRALLLASGLSQALEWTVHASSKWHFTPCTYGVHTVPTHFEPLDHKDSVLRSDRRFGEAHLEEIHFENP